MTREEQNEVLNRVTAMVLEEFGDDKRITIYDPFSPAQIAARAMTDLRIVFKKRMETDEIADSILDNYNGGDPDIENVIAPDILK